VVALFVSLCAVRGDDASSQFVVLKNGQTLHGSIVVLGEKYQITLENGTELRIDSSRVDCLVASLADAYEHKFRRVEPRSFRARAALAEWCLHHRLAEQAATEIAAARLIEPANPRIAGLERRLKSLAEPLPNRVAAGPARHAGIDERPQVRQVAFDAELPAKGATMPARQRTVPQQPTRSEQLAAELPAKALEEFTHFVQPFLLNRCATNNCHGSNELPTFHLIRPPLGKTLSRRLTLQNLDSVLPTIDRANPAASPLLQVPLAPHGPERHSLLGQEGDRAYDKLQHWVGLFESREQPGSRDEPAPYPVPADELAPATSTPDPARGSAAFRPKDPFDPELFNRRYGKR
jgi:hypothetical protein